MSQNHCTTSSPHTFSHLVQKERELIEQWLNEGVTKSHIAERLHRDRSTIYREIKRGTVTQIRAVNGYEQDVQVYYSDSGQRIYEKNRTKSRPKRLHAFSSAFFQALKKAYTQWVFTGKQRTHNIKTFIEHYKRHHPGESVPTFKTVYRYIREGLLPIKPHDLPLMYRLAPRKNKQSKPKGTNKKVLGTSISERPEEVLTRQECEHWEADLVKGKKTKGEPAFITLVERKTRYAITQKIPDYKSETVKEAFEALLSQHGDLIQSITFDNGSEFSSMSELKTQVYFCHAYAAWERGTNENFNQLLREFVPKGISLHNYSASYLAQATYAINQRCRAVIGYRSAADYLNDLR